MFKHFYTKHLLIIFLVQLIIFWPSFFLHFDGDSYLTLWRFQHNTQTLGIPLLTNFFTDYGPQDSLFALIHNIFGFKPFYFYLTSFFLRLLASYTTYLLIRVITNNLTSALLSGITFASITAGLETTNWVFNMPSYLAIILLNILMLVCIKINSSNLKNVLTLALLFVTTIIVQPIRMAILPVFLSFYSICSYITTKKVLFLKYCLIFLVSFLLLFSLGNIGDSVGVTGSIKDKLTGKWLKTNNVNANTISTLINNKDYDVIFYPIGQIGRVIAPNFVIEKKAVFTNNLNYRLIIVETILFILLLNRTLLFNFKRLFIKNLINSSVIVWSVFIIVNFYFMNNFPLTFSELLSLVVGGQFLIYCFSCLFVSNKDCNTKNLLLSSIVLIFLGFLLAWSRNPTTLFESTSRYFIISGLAFSWSVGLIYKLSLKTVLTKTLFGVLIVLNVFSSIYYFISIKQNRSYKFTEDIRRSIPQIPTLNTDETVLFYFHADDQTFLHDTLYFGFPVMMSYYQDVKNIWNVGYTTDWNEVVSSYQDGSGLSRFGTIEIKPVSIDNIYSFDLIDKQLTDTTTVTRQNLINLK